MSLLLRRKPKTRTYWVELGFLVLGVFGLKPDLLLGLFESPSATHPEAAIASDLVREAYRRATTPDTPAYTFLHSLPATLQSVANTYPQNNTGQYAYPNQNVAYQNGQYAPQAQYSYPLVASQPYTNPAYSNQYSANNTQPNYNSTPSSNQNYAQGSAYTQSQYPAQNYSNTAYQQNRTAYPNSSGYAQNYQGPSQQYLSQQYPSQQYPSQQYPTQQYPTQQPHAYSTQPYQQQSYQPPYPSIEHQGYNAGSGYNIASGYNANNSGYNGTNGTLYQQLFNQPQANTSLFGNATQYQSGYGLGAATNPAYTASTYGTSAYNQPNGYRSGTTGYTNPLSTNRNANANQGTWQQQYNPASYGNQSYQGRY
jgi:hypothetical protein